MRNYLQAMRSFNRDLRLFLIAITFHGFAFFGIINLLLNLYILRLGYGPEFLGLVNGIAPLALGLASPLAGVISKRWGTRRPLMAGFGGMVVGFGLLPLAEFMPAAWEAGWLVTTNAFGWIGGSMLVVNIAPFLMSASTDHERNYAFSIQMTLFPLAGFAGNLVGGVLPGLFATLLGLTTDDPAPYRYPLWIAAALILPAFLLMRATREQNGEQTQETVPSGTPLPYGPIIILSLVVLFRLAAEFVVRIFFNAYLDDDLQVSTSMIGLLLAAAQLMGVVALTTPLLISRWGKRRSAVLGTFGMGIAVLPLAAIPHWGAAGLGFMGLMALLSLSNPPFTMFTQEVVPAEWRSTMAGANSLAIGLGIGGMALGGGYFIAAFDYRTLFLMSSVFATAAASLFWAYSRVPRGEYAKAEALGPAVEPGQAL